MNEETRANVLAALQSEGFAYARTTLFAAQAREEGDFATASTLEGLAADVLQRHFAALGELARLVGADADNLSSAIGDKNVRAEDVYRGFAEQARAAGETAVADRFDAIRWEKLEQLHTLEAALERLQAPA